MRNEFLPFSRPSITEQDIAAVADVLRSGWITTGLEDHAVRAEISRNTWVVPGPWRCPRRPPACTWP